MLDFILNYWESLASIIFGFISIFYGNKIFRYKESIKELIREIRISYQDGEVTKEELLKIIDKLKDIFRVE